MPHMQIQPHWQKCPDLSLVGLQKSFSSVSVYIFKFHCMQFHKATKRTTNKVTRIQDDYRELIQ